MATHDVSLYGIVAYCVLLIALTVLDTSEYNPTVYDGNPATVQEVLDQNAPDAPIAAKTGVSSPS